MSGSGHHATTGHYVSLQRMRCKGINRISPLLDAGFAQPPKYREVNIINIWGEARLTPISPSHYNKNKSQTTHLAAPLSKQQTCPLHQRPTLRSLRYILVACEDLAPHMAGGRLELAVKYFANSRDANERFKITMEEDLIDHVDRHLEKHFQKPFDFLASSACHRLQSLYLAFVVGGLAPFSRLCTP